MTPIYGGARVERARQARWNTRIVGRERAIVVGPGEGRTLALGPDARLSFVADEAETDGRYAVSLAIARPGDPGTTPHVHQEHDDVFFITDGALMFEVAGEAFEAPAGTFVLIPSGLRHRWWNPGGEPSTFLNIHVPGYGFESFIRELSALSVAGAASPDAMLELGGRYDVHFDEDVLRERYLSSS
jgi:mannose-6-phosphate isomerase-like protein (cupin superfamily)